MNMMHAAFPQGPFGQYPSPGAVFGYGFASPGAYSPAAGAMFGMSHAAPAGILPQPAPPGCAPPPPAACGSPQAAGRALYPNMPQLSPQAWEQVAVCTLCNAQKQADDRKEVFGIDSGGTTLIAAAGTSTITVSPQKNLIPETLVMSETMASNFLIADIKAGVDSLLSTTGAISAAQFIQDSTTKTLKSIPLGVGMTFSIDVENISGAPARFTCNCNGRPIPWGVQ